MNKTKIEWCDKVWNPVTGCTKIAEGCKNCYAESIAKRFWKGRKFTDVKCHYERLNEPYKIKKPSLIFVNSMSDLFHEKVPFDFIEEIYDVMFDVMFDNPKIRFLILTKRPQRALEFYNSSPFRRFDYANVWLGVSISTQKEADSQLPILQVIPTPNKFISVEPLLEYINFQEFITRRIPKWVIVGCETGRKRRPCEIEWIEQIIYSCKFTPPLALPPIPVFVKQINKKGQIYKNVDYFPQRLKYQEFPEELKIFK